MKLVFVEDDSYRFLCKVFGVVNIVQVAVLVLVVICVNFLGFWCLVIGLVASGVPLYLATGTMSSLMGQPSRK